MTGIELARQAIQNRAKIKDLYDERETTQKSTEAEVSRLKYDIYRDKIHELERERDQKVEETEKQAEAIMLSEKRKAQGGKKEYQSKALAGLRNAKPKEKS